ncbi:MAG: CRISPR-associated protein Csx3 [Ktedonobacteraceae bacterium]
MVDSLDALPAVLIGGPPNAGKSVLLYNLTQALYERGVRHHILRACPDGEGNYFQEGHPVTVSSLRENNKRAWSSDFIRKISYNLEHRCLPFLVDMGGNPRMTELPLFQQCTHAVLLLRADKPDSTQVWQHMVEKAKLRTLAQLFSEQNGISIVTNRTPFLTGNITGLERQSQAIREDPVFIELLESIATLFTKHSLDKERTSLAQAPTQTVVNLPDALRSFTTTSIYWQPEMIAPFLQSVPEHSPLSVHGWGPGWLYAALMAHAEQKAFHQFDPKLPFGWIEPLPVFIGEKKSDEIAVEQHSHDDITVLRIAFPLGRIDYLQPDPLAFPPVPPEQGLILDGPLPQWLLTALVRLYQQAGVAWIAPHYAQQNVREQRKTAIVVYSRTPTHSIGDLIDLPV